jgi:glycosyltransferase involved in cell wall biosynthesis
MVAALARACPSDEWLLFVPGRRPLPDDLEAATEPNVIVRRHPLPGRALFGAAALAGVPRLDRLLSERADVIWLPAPAPLALSPDVPFVLTVHDLSFEERPGDFTAYERLWHRVARPRRLAERAAWLIVDANATRGKLAACWGVDADRVAVVPPGVSQPSAPITPAAVEAARARHRLPPRYLLAVGALEPRKAPELLVRAHRRARAAGLDAGLVFAGGGRLADRLRAPGVTLAGHVPVAELDALYAGATALVMPSWLEGYGLPPLEAIARGTPAVVADLPVYRETLGEGALRFPPGDETMLAQALLRIADDEQLRERLVASGRESIARLTWERAASTARGVFAEAAGR